jgi:hypothetical protein
VSGFDRKLRVGLLVDSKEVQSWARQMIERIQASDHATIVQVVLKTPREAQRASFLTRMAKVGRKLLYVLLTRLEARLASDRFGLFRLESIEELTAGSRWVSVTPETRGFTDRVLPADVESLQADQVDVYVRLGFGILKGEILNAATFGVWSYHHGDNREFRGLPPGFWEVYTCNRVTGLVLQKLSEELDGGEILFRSWSKTDQLLVSRSIQNLFAKSIFILPRMLERLHRDGPDSFADYVKSCNSEPECYSRPLYSYPGNAQMVVLGIKHVARWIGRKFSGLLSFEQWILLFRISADGSPSRALWRFKRITPPRDRFWADPFVMEKDGSYHVFFEELPFATDKGHISHLSITAEGTVSEVTQVLEKPYHLSYPFIIEHENDLFMVPETAANRTIDLYRCTGFPGEWQHEETMLENIEAVDATILKHDERWWMFANVVEHAAGSILDELHLFMSDELIGGSWTPHPQNPIVSDVRESRPAGRIFEHGGRLYRPAQDNGDRYGGSIRLQRIEELSPTRYRETTSECLEPQWARDIVGTHTLNQAGAITIIDGLVRRR